MHATAETATDVAPPGVTEELCTWIHSLTLDAIPHDVKERAKYLILDGLACGLNGAHMPWSEEAAKAVLEFEEPGTHAVIGWGEKVGPLAAALLNGTFIQACELDDFHSVAPLHSGSVLLPALFAAAECEKKSKTHSRVVNGKDFLLACLVGFEVGPRAGMALNGGHMLSIGWHSGPVFGHPAAAAAASKLFGISPLQTEYAIGMACTQACGLMSAQYEGMIKRMQHAFAARNGLFGALLARSGYVGIRKVFERAYGGYLSTFSLGFDTKPRYHEQEVVKELGQSWHTSVIRTKSHACVGGAHGLVEAIASLQDEHPQQMSAIDSITHINIRLSKPVFAHDGWKAEQRPLSATGGQMNCGYIAAVQLLDRQVLLTQFETERLDADDVWALIPKIDCEHGPEFDTPARGCGADVTITFGDGNVLRKVLSRPKGFDPPLPNEDIYLKWRRLTDGTVDPGRQDAIEKAVLGLEDLDDVGKLLEALSGSANQPLSQQR